MIRTERIPQDLKMLTAYNQQLAAKGCKSYNLDQELQKRDPHDMPAATVPAPKSKSRTNSADPAAAREPQHEKLLSRVILATPAPCPADAIRVWL